MEKYVLKREEESLSRDGHSDGGLRCQGPGGAGEGTKRFVGGKVPAFSLRTHRLHVNALRMTQGAHEERE